LTYQEDEKRTRAPEVPHGESKSRHDRVATLPLNSPTSLTGKERLGRKWMDEQRIDNCNVPIDKRGASRAPALALMSRRGGSG
jgi:hypothetical protein